MPSRRSASTNATARSNEHHVPGSVVLAFEPLRQLIGTLVGLGSPSGPSRITNRQPTHWGRLVSSIGAETVTRYLAAANSRAARRLAPAVGLLRQPGPASCALSAQPWWQPPLRHQPSAA